MSSGVHTSTSKVPSWQITCNLKLIEPCYWTSGKLGHVEDTHPPHPHQQQSACGQWCRGSSQTSSTKMHHHAVKLLVRLQSSHSKASPNLLSSAASPCPNSSVLTCVVKFEHSLFLASICFSKSRPRSRGVSGLTLVTFSLLFFLVSLGSSGFLSLTSPRADPATEDAGVEGAGVTGVGGKDSELGPGAEKSSCWFGTLNDNGNGVKMTMMEKTTQKH